MRIREWNEDMTQLPQPYDWVRIKPRKKGTFKEVEGLVGRVFNVTFEYDPFRVTVRTVIAPGLSPSDCDVVSAPEDLEVIDECTAQYVIKALKSWKETVTVSK